MAAVMDDGEIVEILNLDFVLELEASMVYVRNAFLMLDCVPSRLTEAIAIDEMRHMNWLAELIVRRGGVPSMEHGGLDFGEDSLEGYLKRQYELEDGAVLRYKEQIELIDDAEVVGTLKHILVEEKRHRKEFRLQLEKLKQ